jgi:hypothetical protein
VTEYSAIDAILKELERAEKLHPTWPMSTVDQVAIMMEEAGESIRAALNYKYHGGSIDEVRTELIQTGAMCVRCLNKLKPQLEHLEPEKDDPAIPKP